MNIRMWASAASAALVVLLVVWLVARVRVWRSRRKSQRRARLARRGERIAETLLEQDGYQITARQADQRWYVHCDGLAHPIVLRADLLVEKSGKNFVAEVKTGDLAPNLYNAATRRQLLEYSLAYDVEGVLLVDVELGSIQRVTFSSERGHSSKMSQESKLAPRS